VIEVAGKPVRCSPGIPVSVKYKTTR